MVYSMSREVTLMPSLKSRFEELIHMEWDDFYRLEKDKHATVDDTVLCKLIRTCADTDDMHTMLPRFCSRICGSTACDMYSVPRRFTSSTAS